MDVRLRQIRSVASLRLSRKAQLPAIPEGTTPIPRPPSSSSSHSSNHSSLLTATQRPSQEDLPSAKRRSTYGFGRQRQSILLSSPQSSNSSSSDARSIGSYSSSSSRRSQAQPLVSFLDLDDSDEDSPASIVVTPPPQDTAFSVPIPLPVASTSHLSPRTRNPQRTSPRNSPRSSYDAEGESEDNDSLYSLNLDDIIEQMQLRHGDAHRISRLALTPSPPCSPGELEDDNSDFDPDVTPTASPSTSTSPRSPILHSPLPSPASIRSKRRYPPIASLPLPSPPSFASPHSLGPDAQSLSFALTEEERIDPHFGLFDDAPSPTSTDLTPSLASASLYDPFGLLYPPTAPPLEMEEEEIPITLDMFPVPPPSPPHLTIHSSSSPPSRSAPVSPRNSLSSISLFSSHSLPVPSKPSLRPRSPLRLASSSLSTSGSGSGASRPSSMSSFASSTFSAFHTPRRGSTDSAITTDDEDVPPVPAIPANLHEVERSRWLERKASTLTIDAGVSQVVGGGILKRSASSGELLAVL